MKFLKSILFPLMALLIAFQPAFAMAETKAFWDDPNAPLEWHMNTYALGMMAVGNALPKMATVLTAWQIAKMLCGKIGSRCTEAAKKALQKVSGTALEDAAATATAEAGVEASTGATAAAGAATATAEGAASIGTLGIGTQLLVAAGALTLAGASAYGLARLNNRLNNYDQLNKEAEAYFKNLWFNYLLNPEYLTLARSTISEAVAKMNAACQQRNWNCHVSEDQVRLSMSPESYAKEIQGRQYYFVNADNVIKPHGADLMTRDLAQIILWFQSIDKVDEYVRHHGISYNKSVFQMASAIAPAQDMSKLEFQKLLNNYEAHFLATGQFDFGKDYADFLRINLGYRPVILPFIAKEAQSYLVKCGPEQVDALISPDAGPCTTVQLSPVLADKITILQKKAALSIGYNNKFSRYGAENTEIAVGLVAMAILDLTVGRKIGMAIKAAEVAKNTELGTKAAILAETEARFALNTPLGTQASLWIAKKVSWLKFFSLKGAKILTVGGLSLGASAAYTVGSTSSEEKLQKDLEESSTFAQHISGEQLLGFLDALGEFDNRSKYEKVPDEDIVQLSKSFQRALEEQNPDLAPVLAHMPRQ